MNDPSTTNLIIAIVGLCIGVLQGLVIFILNGQSKKIERICGDNRDDHKELRESNQEAFHRINSCEQRITVVEVKVA